jgi:hypothetical protein
MLQSNMAVRKLLIYVDASVVGGCEDVEFASDSLALWRRFVQGRHTLVLSAHTMRELEGAPDAVSAHLDEVPEPYQLLLPDSGRPRNWPSSICVTAPSVRVLTRMPCT